MNKNFKYFLELILVSFLIMMLADFAFAKTECTNLSSNLSFGMTNSQTEGQVSVLQKYLQEKKYLNSAPTGRFGSATLAAVKKLQKANGITANGNVGPATRAAIKKASCLAENLSYAINLPTNIIPQTAVTTSAIIPTVTPALSVIASAISPQPGEILRIGQTYSLIWKGNANSVYDISIEDENGVGRGLIASGRSGNQYLWEVGNISVSSSDNAPDKISPGRYKIRVANSRDGSAKDQVSGIFNIDEKPLVISSIAPSSVAADDFSTVVIYGSGFSKITSVSLDGWSNYISPATISNDGKVILFTVPGNFYPGTHNVQAINIYANNATSTPSNSVRLTITQP